MKILLINYTDGGGGGALAPLRLYEELKKQNIDVDFGVVEKMSENIDIFKLPNYKRILPKIKRKILKKYGDFLLKKFNTANGILHSLNLYSLIDVNFINNSDYDIIHLHWICGNTLSIKDIGKIKKTIIWTMHDSWPVCGAEHHPNIYEDDERYITGYRKDNKPITTRGIDICRFIFKKKLKYFKKPIHFIAPSKWEKRICEKSFLFNRNTSNSIIHIPNLISFNDFYPMDKKIAKAAFNIPDDKIVLGFSTPYFAESSNDMKGSKYLLDALRIFFKTHNPENFICLLIGNISYEFKNQLPNVQSIFTGFLQNKKLLNLTYNACDIFLQPSKVESFSYICLEAQIVGLPVVGFNTSAIPEIIYHKQTGYVSKCFDVDDFSTGINYCIENTETLSINAIKHIKENFNPKKVLNAHVELYKKIYINHYREK